MAEIYRNACPPRSYTRRLHRRGGGGSRWRTRVPRAIGGCSTARKLWWRRLPVLLIGAVVGGDGASREGFQRRSVPSGGHDTRVVKFPSFPPLHPGASGPPQSGRSGRAGSARSAARPRHHREVPLRLGVALVLAGLGPAPRPSPRGAVHQAPAARVARERRDRRSRRCEARTGRPHQVGRAGALEPAMTAASAGATCGVPSRPRNRTPHGRRRGEQVRQLDEQGAGRRAGRPGRRARPCRRSCSSLRAAWSGSTPATSTGSMRRRWSCSASSRSRSRRT
jgi:hypothetical protein